MQQLLDVWTRLDFRKQVLVILATGVMFFAIIVMSRLASAPSMTLLYAGLESSAAGDVVRALEQRGVAFEVRGGSIFVDADERDQLRLTLASEGLPANGNRGYELLDSLTGFGTTSQMFDAAYWRAKEGELARTIVTSPQIAFARVHIAAASGGPFQRGITPKASVSITPHDATINPAQAKAVRFLVASAVAGLAPEDVAVIDANGALVGAADDTTQSLGGDNKAQILKERVQRLLEARVGHGNAIVEVSVDTVTASEAIRERRFDPKGRVAISTDTQERTNNSEDGGAGDVTVASNLPDNSGSEGSGSTSQNSETRERVNYEVSETEREIVKSPGAVKRLTVAVLVNALASEGTAGELVFKPREDQELNALRELVASAVGFDESRGDVITIKSMELQSIAPIGTAPTDGLLQQVDLDLMSVVQMIILALVTLILGLFVVRPIFSKTPSLPDPAPVLPGIEAPPAGQTALIGELQTGDLDLPELPDIGMAGGLPTIDELPDLTQIASEPQDPVERLRNLIGERQDETVEILRGWLENKEENA